MHTYFEEEDQAVSSQYNNLVVRVENLSVRYHLPTKSTRSIKEYLFRLVNGHSNDKEEFWALRNINLELSQGEIFGIVGHNGAGKSTLLKVLARVLHPTEGRVWIRGSVAPLIQLGGGFHPDLTARENILLNGTLLGHTRQKIEQRFDEMIDFSELWDFVDLPLRTYSTGMIARLGFAVATAWRPDVLLVDEVLSVGDQDFREKCSDRIENFRSQGTTILLVSNTIRLIQELCSRMAILWHGEIQMLGPTEEVMAKYKPGQFSRKQRVRPSP